LQGGAADGRNETLQSLVTVVGRIPSLDGIRALSFLVVFLSHAGPNHTIISGDVGVTTFFFLSGFLITTLMRTETERSGSLNVRKFYLRRALRIFPPFYLVWFAAVLLGLLLYPAGTLYGPTLLAQALFVSNYEGIYGANREIPGTGILWSLSVEEHFYLLFPWLYIALVHWRVTRINQARLLWSLCALVLAWRCFLVIVAHANGGGIFIRTDTRVDSILFGCALALWNNPALDEPILSRRLWKLVLLPLALLALLFSILYQGMLFKETWYFSLQGVALTLVFTAAIRFHDWPLFRWLNSRPLVLAGALSYSLYLVHGIVIYAVAQLMAGWSAYTRAGISLIAILVLASAIYVSVEKPCARLRKRLEA
jgi:peptidoglycan/LPS O-acetylase OafA/YrhL